MQTLTIIICFIIGDVIGQLLAIVIILRGADSADRRKIFDSLEYIPFVFWPPVLKLVRHWNEE